MNSLDLSAGQSVDHYEVLRPIGAGGMARVFLVRDTVLGRRAALKLVQPERLGDRTREQFLNEARAMAHFNHPNIVTVFGVGDFQQVAYIAMEYVEGETLRQRMQSQAMSQKEVLRLCLAIASALEEAHARNIAHSDLKPENIIIGKDGRLRVVDFGLARGIDTSLPTAPAQGAVTTTVRVPTRERAEKIAADLPELVSGSSNTGAAVGTPAYMSPEQWNNENKTNAVDIWALGVIFFELLSGRRPFEQPTLIDLCVAITDDAPAPPIESLCDVEPDVARLVNACLSKQFRERPTAAECVAFLFRALHGTSAPDQSDDSPFRGLSAFTEQNAGFFFGRDDDIANFIERMREEVVLPIVGSSGVGKSSFIQAGVIPRLREQGEWRIIRMRPGSQPFRVLAERLVRDRSHASEDFTSDLDGDLDFVAHELATNPKRLALWLRHYAKVNACKMLLLVDQLEEVCTLVSDEQVRLAFLASVCNAADDPQEPVRVVFTARDDFLTRLAQSPEARAALQRVTVLRAPGRDALVNILEGPLRVVGYHYDSDTLVSEMIASVENESAALPLLQFCGAMLWERRNRGDKLVLTSAYRAIGGVQGALATHAQAFMRDLSEQQTRLVRAAMLRLATPEGTRRVVSEKALLEALGPGGDEVLLRLTSSRLLSVREQLGEVQLELSHESLMHTWDRLVGWLDEGREELVFLAQLEQATELWLQRGRPVTEVWTGNALADAERNLDRFRTRLSEHTQAFITQSRKRERARLRLRAIAAATGVAALVIIAIVSLITATRFAEKTRIAEEQRKQAREQQAQALAEGARSAFQRGDFVAARAQLRTSLEIADSSLARAVWGKVAAQPVLWSKRIATPAGAAAVTTDGKRAAVAGPEMVYLFDGVLGSMRLLRDNPSQAFALAFSPSGDELLAGDGAGKLSRWSLRDDKYSVFQAHDAMIEGLSYSPDGLRFASVSRDGTAKVWNRADGAIVFATDNAKEALFRGEFSADSRTFWLALPNAALQGFDANTGRPTISIHADTAKGKSAVLTSAGSRHAFATDAGWVVVVDAEGRALCELQVLTDKPAGLALLHGGETLAVGDFAGRFYVYGVSNCELRERTKLASALSDLRAYGDDAVLLSAFFEQTVTVRKVPRVTTGEIAVAPHQQPVASVLFIGEQLLSAGRDGRVIVWDTRSGTPSKAADIGIQSLASMAFGDGHLVVGSVTGQIAEIDERTLQPTATWPVHASTVQRLWIDQRDTVVSVSLDRTMRRTDLSTGKVATLLTQTNQIYGGGACADVVVTSDGDEHYVSRGNARPKRFQFGFFGALAFDPACKLLRFFDENQLKLITCNFAGACTPAQVPQTLPDSTGHTAASADGRWLAVSNDARVTLFATTPSLAPQASWVADTTAVTAMTFSPDSKQLAVGTMDAAVRLFSVPSGTPGWLGPPRADRLEVHTPLGRAYFEDSSLHVGGTSVALPGKASTIAVVDGVVVVGFAAGGPIAQFDAGRGKLSTLELQENDGRAPLLFSAGTLNTLAVGFADGLVGVWSSTDGALLASCRANGAVSQLQWEGASVTARTDAGGTCRVDVSKLVQPREALLRELGQEVPYTWQDGAAQR